jgi:YHS domain-containing protein
MLFFFSTRVSAQSPAEARNARHFWLNEKGIAYDGYDATSYFTGKPLKGTAAYSVRHEGIVYWFANAQNQEVFKKTPDRFVPAYGGWCSYAIGAKGEKVEPDPQNFKIVSGRVNLFYRSFFANTLDDWNADEKALKAKADQNWTQKIYR